MESRPMTLEIPTGDVERQWRADSSRTLPKYDKCFSTAPRRKTKQIGRNWGNNVGNNFFF